MSDLLKVAQADEEGRRQKSFEALTELSRYFRSLYDSRNTEGLNKDWAINLIEGNLYNINVINHYLNATWAIKTASHALKTNKLKELFTCAKQFVSDNFEELVSKDIEQVVEINPNERTFLGGHGSDVKGTSLPNCIQTALISMIYGTSSDASQYPSAMDISLSPILQSAILPYEFEINNVQENLDQWPFFYKDDLSPKQGELVIPTLGYAFGGSRADSRYSNKLYKNYDCSSAVAAWTNASQLFATVHMKEYFYDANCTNDYCLTLRKILIPVTLDNLDLVHEGDVFVRINDNTNIGHTGVVSNVPKDAENSCFETLSYNRNAVIEGLGYREECIDPSMYSMMFFRSNTDLAQGEVNGVCEETIME